MSAWPNIYPQGSGYIVDCGVVDGKRKRLYKSTNTAAKDEAARLRDERKRGKLGALAISDSDLRDAVTAITILEGTGISLESLARAEIAKGVRTDLLVCDLYDEYFKQREKVLNREKSIESIKYREGRFAAEAGGVNVRSLTAENIETWLDGCRVSPVSYNAYLRAVRTMLHWAVKKGYTDRNPALALDFIKTDALRPTVFDTDQVCNVLAWCMLNKPDLVPYYAVGFFAGLRPEEIKRMTKAEVNRPAKLITVTPAMSKTHMRHVKIRSVLDAWLKEYPIKDSIYWKRYWVEKMEIGTGIDWPPDVCRKSFISYHLAAFRNQQDTALEAGHRDTTMLYTNYRNIKTITNQQLTGAYAKIYWKLTPAAVRTWNTKRAGA